LISYELPLRSYPATFHLEIPSYVVLFLDS
jgi:hypothetical protein